MYNKFFNEFSNSVKIFSYPLLFFIFLAVLLLFLSPITNQISAANLDESSQLDGEEDSLLIIHVDGVSYQVFQEQLNKGNLPNLESYFSEEGMINRAVTYFPPETSVVISRLTSGRGADEGWIVDESGYRREDDHSYSFMEPNLSLISDMHRRSWDHALYQWPVIKHLEGFSLVNAVELLETYPVLEFYWFSTDFYGHRSGKEAQLEELARFDRNFGRLVERMPEDVSIIIYADHGMTFGEGTEVKEPLAELLGDKILEYSYPNIYLQPEENFREDGIIRKDRLEEVEEMSRQVVNETPLDFAFFRSGERKVIGLSEKSRMILRGRKSDGRISYSYEGRDELGYYEAGYEGEYLSRQEWTEMTIDKSYPAAPAAIYTFLNNPEVGEIVTVLNPPDILTGGYVRRGHHLSLNSDDMKVPLLVRGELVEDLYEKDDIWLPHLFTEKLDLDLENNTPSREKHNVNLRVGEDTVSGTLSYSPTYRLRFGLDAHSTDIYLGGNENSDDENKKADDYSFKAWGVYDVFSSYLHRLWFGFRYESGTERSQVLPHLRYDFRLRGFTASFIRAPFTDEETSLRLSYNLTSSLDLKLVDFSKVGIGFNW